MGREFQQEVTSLTHRPPPDENTGIISNAIANAGKVFSEPGQENISLLSQHSNTSRPRPASAQFTFTCDSQVPGTQWPGMDPAVHSSLPAYGGASRTKHASMGTQTATANAGANQQGAPAQGNAGAPAAAKKKKSRRRAERDLKMAAAHRRREPERKPTTTRPVPRTCGYASSANTSRFLANRPTPLIRQYEIKDQKARRQEQERKRLLEKAKAKSRKGRRPTVASPTPNTPTTNAWHVPVRPAWPAQGTQGCPPREEAKKDSFLRVVQCDTQEACIWTTWLLLFYFGISARTAFCLSFGFDKGPKMCPKARMKSMVSTGDEAWMATEDCTRGGVIVRSVAKRVEASRTVLKAVESGLERGGDREGAKRRGLAMDARPQPARRCTT
ncbi:predicted protein [Verticillium alfalfae VaMs.102]|uniref:Predicted protein n=1 Tax=Verticillium alfalfae (strain VaMs.102 / ATCC MYA-4576 / FGSC 10136) TaxID=526221 RepID=C9S703_VERA1|nr:predicted protein [Verticillium alfalfae VaMs.102]EEY14614.1 predicted protein [Verticillium alfalfae VaMs.102]